jgi:hypothetical protein
VRKTLCIDFINLAAFCPIANSQSHTVSVGSGNTFTITPTANGDQIVINMNFGGGSNSIVVRGNSSSAVLSSLIVNLNTSQLCTLRVLGPTDLSPTGSIGSITYNQLSSGDLIITELRSAGSVGSIRAHGLNFADISGSVTGNITIDPRPTNPSGLTVLLDTSINGSVLGNINCESGYIANLVVGGTIGTPSNPVTVSAKGSSNSFITRIRCSAFYGTLRGPGTQPAPQVGEFRTTSGPIVGELRFDSIYNNQQVNEGLYCAGDLDANVTVSNAVAGTIQIGGEIKANRSVIVPALAPADIKSISVRTLNKDATFSLGAGLPSDWTMIFGSSTTPGLAGQVIIRNPSNTAGSWLGSVRVGGASGTLLSPIPSYTNSATTLGNGAVGEVPFRLRQQECTPAPIGGVRRIARGAFGFNTAAHVGNAFGLSFYGPVTGATTGNIILESFNEATSTWSAVPAANYAVSTVSDWESNNRGRGVYIKGTTTFPLGRYRVSATSGLRSDLGLGAANPSITPTTPVEFVLTDQQTCQGTPNPADIANDQGEWLNDPARNPLVPNNGVNEGDYNLFFNCFFLAAPANAPANIANDAGTPLPGSFGVPNNGVNEGDYNAFFNSFFFNCT